MSVRSFDYAVFESVVEKNFVFDVVSVEQGGAKPAALVVGVCCFEVVCN